MAVDEKRTPLLVLGQDEESERNQRPPSPLGRYLAMGGGLFGCVGVAALLLYVLGPNSSIISTTTTTTTTTKLEIEGCLCVFDIDRTLTGKQNKTEECPQNKLTSVFDTAYGGGKLTLSEVAQRLNETFCASCFLAIITAGTASGENSAERRILLDMLHQGGKLTTDWWNPIPLHCDVQQSPLVTRCGDKVKQYAVPGIQKWYKDIANVHIPDAEVYFFDDRSNNVEPFHRFAYNARQVSCDSREGSIGFCGARLSEIVREKGVRLCN